MPAQEVPSRDLVLWDLFHCAQTYKYSKAAAAMGQGDPTTAQVGS